jgi:hypothetical protein
VDLPWLQQVWHELPSDWVERFWKNDKGNRAEWIKKLANASAADKHRINDIAKEQLSFRELWDTPGTLKVQKINWKPEPFASLNKLLKSFYAPLFYDAEGYAFSHCSLAKSAFLEGIDRSARKVCLYCDNYLQTPELDHFLPKDDFPFLSCHPDNLIPSCHDSNSISHKGTSIPLDLDEADQTANWFHPRWRSAQHRIKVEIEEKPDLTLAARLAPLSPRDEQRVSNLDQMFKLSAFWSNHIEGELQLIGSQVSDMLDADEAEPDESTVKTKLDQLAKIKEREIGRRGLAICHSALYRFAAETPSVVSDILRQCREQASYATS